jgi:hypothetical protein
VNQAGKIIVLGAAPRPRSSRRDAIARCHQHLPGAAPRAAAANFGLQPTWPAAFLPSKLCHHGVAGHAAEPWSVGRRRRNIETRPPRMLAYRLLDQSASSASTRIGGLFRERPARRLASPSSMQASRSSPKSSGPVRGGSSCVVGHDSRGASSPLTAVQLSAAADFVPLAGILGFALMAAGRSR